MKWLFSGLMLTLVMACAPAVQRSNAGFPIQAGEVWNLRLETAQTIRFDFSLDGAPFTDKTNWLYANLKSSTATVVGTAAVPDDKKTLVMVFSLDSKRTSQVSCVVPMTADFSRAIKGMGALYSNDRKVSDAACTLSPLAQP